MVIIIMHANVKITGTKSGIALALKKVSANNVMKYIIVRQSKKKKGKKNLL